MFQDLRYAARMLLKSKGHTAIALLSLALGIGANTALFSLADAMEFRPLAVQNPRDLVLFKWVARHVPPQIVGVVFDGNRKDSSGLIHWDSFSYRAFEEFRSHNQTLSDVFAFARIYQLDVIADGAAEITGGEYVSGSYFSGLGVNAIRGRTIEPADDTATAPPVAVIGYHYWERRFGLDPSVVGKTIGVNGIPLTIVGISPREFSGTLQVDDSPDLYIPMALQALTANAHRAITDKSILDAPEIWWLQILGRPKPGVSVKQVRANFDAIFHQTIMEISAGKQDQAEAPRLEVVSGSRGLTSGSEGYAQPLLILTVIMVLVLFIACVNVANLLVARAAARQKEIATRLSVGATHIRLLRQLLTESVLLALLGGVLGLAFAYGGKDLLLHWGPWTDNPQNIAKLQNIDVRIDLRVMGFAAIVSLLTGFLFGLTPALKALRTDMASAMMDNARTSKPVRSTLSKPLLVVQVAVSVVLLIGAGLFVRTLHNFQYVDIGFDPHNLLLFNIDPRLNGYDPVRFVNAVEEMIGRIGAIHGVQAATVSNQSLAGGGFNFMSHVESDGRKIAASPISVRGNFFEALGVPILLGRTFTSRDDRAAPGVAVINETLARQYFGDASPIGKMVWDREIVGVVRDATVGHLRQEVPPVIYSPYLQSGAGLTGSLTFEVRTAGDPRALLPAIREAVRQVDPNLPLYGIKTQEEQIDQTLRQERLFASVSVAFGVLALFLVCVGLYGIMSYTVTRRTHEIGIRMALGAQRRNVAGLVMRETMVLVLTGIAIGVASVYALNRFVAALQQQLDRLLFQLKPNDEITFLAAILIMIAVAALGGYLPARRASRVDPTVALRYE